MITRLAVTPGDPAGIGPEIVWKAIQEGSFDPNQVQMICFGAAEPFKKLGARIKELSLGNLYHHEFPNPEKDPVVYLVPAPIKAPKPKQHLGGFQSGWSIAAATGEVLSGRLDALVTGPISKENLVAGGFDFPGHTEMLASLSRKKGAKKGPSVTMMLANDYLKVTLVTIHIPLRKVAMDLKKEAIVKTIHQTADAIRMYWNVATPKIAVCGLNPHAGERGLLGCEDQKIIAKAIRSVQAMQKAKIQIQGPLPADTLFANNHLTAPENRFDAVVCMYHDQGLIPVKLLDFKNTVNITLGLPFIRTSVDHGTGFDIAGRGVADPSSFKSAVRLANNMLKSGFERTKNEHL